jgi:isocitrate dehydrogenase (NAD+)
MKVVLIQGGGVGIDQEAAVRRIVAAAGVDIDWQVCVAGREAIQQGLPALTSEMFEAVRQTGIALKTKLLNPPGPVNANLNLQFRHDLGLFASVRPIRNLPGIPSRFQGLDILLVREITEDLYTAIEHEIVPGVVQSLKVVTATACLRFFRDPACD